MSLLLRMLRRLTLLAERRLDTASVERLPLPTNGLAAETVRQHLRRLDLEGRDYLDVHLERLVHTLRRVPRAHSNGAELLELGSYGHFTAILTSELLYNVRGAYLGPAGHTDRRIITAGGDKLADILIDLFNAERDAWPYENDRFDGVLVCEVIEHLMRPDVGAVGGQPGAEAGRLDPGDHAELCQLQEPGAGSAAPGESAGV